MDWGAYRARVPTSAVPRGDLSWAPPLTWICLASHRTGIRGTRVLPEPTEPLLRTRVRSKNYFDGTPRMSSLDQRRLSAIMFTDMVGFSALSQRNEALALELLEEHRWLIRGFLTGHGGREVKTTGDGFLIEFPSALAASKAAVEIQKAFSDRDKNSSPEREIQIRIGIHVGDVVERDGDIHGDGVNIAARIEPLAEPGGICLTNSVRDQIENKIDYALVELTKPELKNIQAKIRVYRVVLDGATIDARKETSPAG